MDTINRQFKKGDSKLTISFIQKYILDFVNYEDMLDKRVNKAFSLNGFLRRYTTKDDVKQEILVKMFSPPVIEKFLWFDGIERLRYFNTVVSNVLFTIYRDAKLQPYPVDINIDCNFTPQLIIPDEVKEESMLREMWELFTSEHLERGVLKLLYEGYNNKEIQETLDISQYKLEQARENIRQKLIDKGYNYLQREEK